MKRNTAFNRIRRERERREFWARVFAGALAALMMLSIVGVFMVAAILRVNAY